MCKFVKIYAKAWIGIFCLGLIWGLVLGDWGFVMGDPDKKMLVLIGVSRFERERESRKNPEKMKICGKFSGQRGRLWNYLPQRF